MLSDIDMKRVINIGLAGLSFFSENLGCEALAYSFLNMLEELQEDYNINMQLYVLTDFLPCSGKEQQFKLLRNAVFVEYHVKSIGSIVETNKCIKKCNIVFDFTEGDSFTDIYGIKRFVKISLIKYLCLKNNVPLFLGPQTYGPYKNAIVKKIAGDIIRKSNYVTSRDSMSTKCIEEVAGIDAKTYIDIAFSLPFQSIYDEYQDKVKIGINISGLLWSGGYKDTNEFGLKVDYQKYIKSLIAILQSKYEIHLISHVICNEQSNPEDDYFACKLVQEEFNNCILEPKFENPMDVKSCISSMDLFIGARMHATIAAFSSGVPVIPFSYSRKFEGLFNGLNYSYCINGRSLSTEQAIEQTVAYVECIDELKKAVDKGMCHANKMLELFKKMLQEVILEKCK